MNIWDTLLRQLAEAEPTAGSLPKPWEHQRARHSAAGEVPPEPLPAHPSTKATTPQSAALLVRASKLAQRDKWVEHPEDYLEEALETARQLQDQLGEISVQVALAQLTLERGDRAGAEQHLQQALDIAGALDDEAEQSWLHFALRALPHERPAESYWSVSGQGAPRPGKPLRILAMVAAPGDLKPQGVADEQKHLSDALQPLVANRYVALTWVAGNTWDDLRQTMEHGSWDVFHFIGYGDIDSQLDEGGLALAGEHGKHQFISAKDVGALLAGHDSLRLVVLTAYARHQQRPAKPFSRVEATLQARGVPATFSTPPFTSAEAMSSFVRSLYVPLALSTPLETILDAVQQQIRLRQSRSPDS